MYGLSGTITATEGKRDALITVLLEAINAMPGCLSYIISKDAKDDHLIRINEVWDSQISHKESLSLPRVQNAITKARPMIREFGEQVEMEPVGGIGLLPQW